MSYLLSFLLLVLLSTQANAQSAEPPTYMVGESWTFSDGREVSIVKVEGDVTISKGQLLSCPACLFHVDKNLVILKIVQADGTAPDSAAIGFVPVGSDWKFLEFPLAAGKKWSFGAKGLFRNTVNHYDIVNTVLAYEDVTTKAGTFKAFRLTRDWNIRPIDNRGRGSSWSTVEWYAPSVKRIVKYTTTNPNGREWELVSYTVK
jgi:hypothetical protein